MSIRNSDRIQDSPDSQGQKFRWTRRKRQVYKEERDVQEGEEERSLSTDVM